MALCVFCLIDNYKASVAHKRNLFFDNGKIAVGMQRSKVPRHPFVQQHICDNEVPPIIYQPDQSEPPRQLQDINFDWAGSAQSKQELQQLVKRSQNAHYSSVEIDKELLNVELFPPSCACQTKVSQHTLTQRYLKFFSFIYSTNWSI